MDLNGLINYLKTGSNNATLNSGQHYKAHVTVLFEELMQVSRVICGGLEPTVWCSILVGGAVAVMFYVIFYVPFSWTKYLTDVGYDFINDTTKNRSQSKEFIQRHQKLRKIGNKMPPPYPNGWFAVMESRDLKPGQSKSVYCLGETLAVFRTEEGRVHILNAYCPHLGANLGTGGVVRGDCIECPFHQWTFSGEDGECKNIPYSTLPIPKQAKLKKWESQEVNGSIFVWYHAEDEQPWELPSVVEIDRGDWVYHGRNSFEISCHIQEIPENGADVAHLAAVHGPNMFSGVDLRFTRSFLDCIAMHTWDANWLPPNETGPQQIANMTLKHAIRLFNKVEVCSLSIVAQQIGPGYVQLLMHSSFGPMICLQTVTPLEPLVQKVVHRFYGPRSIAWFAKFTLWGETVMFQRDMMVWNSKQYMDTPLLVKEDKKIKTYRQWYSQFYSENSVSFKMSRETLDW